MSKRISTMLAGAAAVIVIAAAGLAAVWWTGGYNVAADEAHSRPVASALTSMRERSVSARARRIAVPDLESPQMVALGAKQYREMCASCHLAPGIENTELRRGLNPRPPDLARHGVHDPAESFWIVKYGIKMSGMPAWGLTHDDQTLWAIVAFMQRMPKLSAKQFDELSSDGAFHHDAN
ncbi:cytochrome c [Variovorax sp. NFACC27]|jgi:mono/diheme cytochrome c family protein|uniref:Cytochrome c n=1 Tax=Variovorax paradoxus TaxID=34073 RepID=A0A5Q0M0E5_VARPD|nr:MULTISPECIES: cytochrome c [Variovorax]SEF19257.1 Cytochrome C oxidase, cbb3-type, subunit III [Variovorax sp. NFACC28]SEF75295.1 Cytochrome C oxidase, cbb3-type, subunit III [Variovorax sp. NFACC29]SFB78901.1 Cytochrome C oxidase, cbb3-type, subunit III [Variovorax sp. NFACC26]SFG78034.1 Cytochrome C oxidase, cbb3-type, subunit III [Variovorax sp. NFACC27]MDN6887833.1 cytochrome c [Variovorax sp. CAN15]